MSFFTKLNLRGRKFYGKPVVEGVQRRSETLYMPHYTPHAVYNLDQTVAVGDNPFFSTAIEQSAFDLYRNGYNDFAYIKDKIYLHKGELQVIT